LFAETPIEEKREKREGFYSVLTKGNLFSAYFDKSDQKQKQY